jgi:hypothetical protein
LGVDAVNVGSGISKVYIDLGLPAGDATAMADIQALLGSIDPASQAKLVNGAQVKDFSLVMSGDLAKTIIEAGGFNETDVANMAKWGINEITLLDSIGNLAAADQALFAAMPVEVPVAQTPPILPTVVTIVGSSLDNQLPDDLIIKQ